MSKMGSPEAVWLGAHRDHWHLGFNDPNLHGWIAVVGYALGAALALRASRVAKHADNRFDRRFWQIVCAILLALGINKQLDLHVLLIDLGRDLALDSNLFAQRRQIQLYFMLAIVVLPGSALIAAVLHTRNRGHAIRWALAGVAITGVYGLVRAASFNHVDRLIGIESPWPIEFLGIAITALAAWRYRPGNSA